jgi:hypothetical protein
MSESSVIINENNSDTLIVSFSGHDRVFGEIPKFEFVNFFKKNFKHIDRHFYIDKNITSYHKGITGISNNIQDTADYLKIQIDGYKNVIFLGVSSGGYAAILFGSLLKITSVLAFIPQTVRRDKIVDENYRDIHPFINDVTKYYLYGDLSTSNPYDPHHISHCDRLNNYPNVFIIRQQKFNLKRMRDNGELFKILKDLVENT